MSERRWKSLLKYLGACFLLIFCLLPFFWMVVVSFSRNPDFLSLHTPFVFTLQNYVEILTRKSVHLLHYLKNSLIISALSALVATFFASLAAYAITRLHFPGRVIIPVFMLAFSMFPQISMVGYLFKLMTPLHWINTYQALIFPYITIGLPLALWIMLSYFSQLSTDLDNAALVDGATRFQVLRKIIFPVALPGALSTLLLIFIYSFNEFLFALMLTIDYNARTVPVGISLFEGLHGQVPWGHIMASAVIATIPVVVLAAIFQRHIIQGLTRGAIKG
ncbi:MAG: carbohydrate ABC transporter permease [Candidatus Aminicenantes bacterium]